MKLYDILTSEDIVASINDNFQYIIKLIPEIKGIFGFDHMHPHRHFDV